MTVTIKKGSGWQNESVILNEVKDLLRMLWLLLSETLRGVRETQPILRPKKRAQDNSMDPAIY